MRNHGLEALMRREKPGPKPERCRGLDPAAEAQFKAKPAAGEFVTVVQAQRWLKEAHGAGKPCHTVWRWIKKAKGVPVRPRPVHSRKDPAAGEKFKEELEQKLDALHIAEGSRVRIWTMDGARFGLHTRMRRVWALRGKRPVIPRQIKYQRDCLYGSLDVTGGQAHFARFRR